MNQEPNTSHAVVAEGLGKRYGEQWALREFDLVVPTGSVLGLLGHNGAGKTTAIRILTTLAAPSEGRATVVGHDVVTEPLQVREQIGLTSQSPTVDGLLSGAANLEMIGRLYHLPAKVARARGAELLTELGLDDAGDRLVKDYSGGMRRRLDLAASLVASPPVLFLDEPTTGLDPESRNELWDVLRQLVGGGTTVILTTQYLEEADVLADDIVLLDHGKIVATGTPTQLKAQHGGERVVVTVDDPEQLAGVARALEGVAAGAAEIDREELLVTAPASESTRLIEVVRALEDGGIDAHDVRRRESTLDDVFFSLTSPRARHGHAPPPSPTKPTRRPQHERQRDRRRRPAQVVPRARPHPLAGLRRLGPGEAPVRPHPPDPGEAVRRNPAADHVRAALRLRLRRRDPRPRRRRLPRISDRRDPRPDARLRADGTGDVDGDRPRRRDHRPLQLAADVTAGVPDRPPHRGVRGDPAGDHDHGRSAA